MVKHRSGAIRIENAGAHVTLGKLSPVVEEAAIGNKWIFNTLISLTRGKVCTYALAAKRLP
eukprot:COSAG01_NODE_60_length_29981_cov_23.262533_22_plen_61_part_00